MAKYIVTHGIQIANSFVPETFGRLTTLGPKFKMTQAKDSRRHYVVCMCTCGEICVKQCRFIESGKTQSCGCLLIERIKETQTTHGHAVKGKERSPELDAYYNMLARCNNPNRDDWPDYGGRGICVFPGWDCDGGFSVWLAYMGPRPSKRHSVDRFPDPNGNYEPGNVRWATVEQQANNKRSNRYLEFQGKTQSMADWARETGIRAGTIKDRLKAGWSVEKALTLPSGQKTGPKPKI